jgi:peptide/nickel transport system substrate-binding protein
MRSFRVTFVLAVAALVLLGQPAGASTPTAARPQKGGTLSVFVNSEIVSSLDPIALRGVPFTESPGPFAVYDALFYNDPTTMAVVPRLGLSLTSTDNGTTWTLKLRPNVKFSDGTAFDAAAVQFNWQRIADPANKALAFATASAIQTMQVVDPLTLRITLKSPDPNYNHRVADALSSIASPTAIKSMGASFGDKGAVGAGPFILKEWLHNDHMTFVRNPNYWETGRPYVDQLTVKIVLDDNTRYNTFKTTPGSIDYEFGNPASLGQAKQDGVQINTGVANGGGWGLAFNTATAPFNDVRVREAINLALDRTQFNDVRRSGNKALAMTTLDRAGTPYYDPKIALPKTNLAAAQKLIDQVVAETGKPVSFTLTTYTTQYINLDTQLIQAQLAKVKNLNVAIETLATTSVIQKFTSGDYQAYPTSAFKWVEPAVDMTNSFLSTSATNYMRYNNPTVDAALNQLKTAADPKTQVQLVHQVEQQLLKDVPEALYTRAAGVTLVDKTVKGFATYFDERTLLDQLWISTKS